MADRNYAPPPEAPPLEAPPPEMMAAVVRNAEEDADLVIALLKKLGFSQPALGGSLRLPAAFLLGLGVVLRMTLWEVRGIHLHLEEGLPTAQEAMYEVVRRTASPNSGNSGPDEFVVSLWRRVLELSVRRFVWQGPEIVGGEVLVGELDDDLLIDALAQFVLQRRHTGSGPE